MNRTQYDAKAAELTRIFADAIVKPEIDTVMLGCYGKRPEDEPHVMLDGVRITYARHSYHAEFPKGDATYQFANTSFRDAATCYVECTSLGGGRDDDTLTELLALDPDGQVAKLRAEVKALEDLRTSYDDGARQAAREKQRELMARVDELESRNTKLERLYMEECSKNEALQSQLAERERECMREVRQRQIEQENVSRLQARVRGLESALGDAGRCHSEAIRELEKLRAGQMAPKDSDTNDVLPSEALFGFMAWLTSRSMVSGPFSGSHGASEAAELVAEFYMSQGFAEPREGVYPKNLKPYPKEPSAAVAGPAPKGRELVEGVSEDSIDSICHCGKDITNAANHRCDECRRSIFGNTTAPKDANALGFANVYPDGVSDLFPHESDARKAAGSEAIRIAVPLYDHPVTEAECISAFEKLGHKRFASHVTGEIWFTKNHSGGDHE